MMMSNGSRAASGGGGGHLLIIGCGYLGERLARRRLARGGEARVVATTRRPERAEELSRLGVEPVVCDVVDPSSLQKSLPQSVDSVVYAVGLDRAAGLPMRQVYVDGLNNVLACLPSPVAPAAPAAATGRFLYISSTGVYGQSDGSAVDESAPTEPQDDSGKVVLEAESLLRRHRPDAIVLRLAGIYGPGRLLRASDLLAQKPLAIDPDVWLNLIHVEDAVTAVEAALQHGQPGAVYNVADDRPVRRRDFYSRLAQELRAPPPCFVSPARPEQSSSSSNRRILNARMRRELGVELRYPSFEEGLAASVRPA